MVFSYACAFFQAASCSVWIAWNWGYPLSRDRVAKPHGRYNLLVAG